MFWILVGVFAFLLIRNHFELQGVAKDVRMIARSVRKIAKDLIRTVRQAVKDAKKEAAETRETAPEQISKVTEVHEEQPAQPEAQQNDDLLKDLEKNARTAAMMASVPTIDFPKDDPKYDSSKKYMYA